MTSETAHDLTNDLMYVLNFAQMAAEDAQELVNGLTVDQPDLFALTDIGNSLLVLAQKIEAHSQRAVDMATSGLGTPVAPQKPRKGSRKERKV